MSDCYTELQDKMNPQTGEWEKKEVLVEIADGEFNPSRRSSTIEWKNGIRYLNGVDCRTIKWCKEYMDLHKGEQK